MTFNFGINNQNSENSFTMGYSNKKYTEKLSKLLGIEDFNLPMRVDLVFSRSSYFSKYTLDLKNPFFFKLFSDTWTTDFEINSKNKKIKYINYEILPSFKLATKSTSVPVSLYIKHANYRASAEQDFGSYDFSQLLKSLLPYDRTSIGVKFEDIFDFKIKSAPEIFANDKDHKIVINKRRSSKDQSENKQEVNNKSGLDNLLVYKLKLNYNKIKGYEDAVKFRANGKYFKDLENGEKFTLGFTNETSLKNSFIFNAKGAGRILDSSINNANISSFNISSEDANIINPHHILSTNEAYSRILDLNINNVYKEFNVGNKFCLTNHMQIKLKNIQYLRDFSLFQYLCPFVGFEAIFVPVLDKNFYSTSKRNLPIYKMIDYDESIKFVANAGFALQINDNISIDFTLKTYTKGFKSLDASVFDKFRMNMNVSMNI
jgi:hypothetical protein